MRRILQTRMEPITQQQRLPILIQLSHPTSTQPTMPIIILLPQPITIVNQPIQVSLYTKAFIFIVSYYELFSDHDM